MDITNLTLSEVSGKLKHFVTIYFIDSTIVEEEGGLFNETVTLYGEEVRHLIPPEHNSRFRDDDAFQASSGFIRFKMKGYQLT